MVVFWVVLVRPVRRDRRVGLVEVDLVVWRMVAAWLMADKLGFVWCQDSLDQAMYLGNGNGAIVHL